METITKSKLESGLRIPRLFTHEGQDIYSTTEWDKRASVIRNPDGSMVFELHGVEVPKAWTQVATDILAQKYFRKTGVPQSDDAGNALLDKDGNPVLGSEKSLKQMINRLVGCWRFWGEMHGYFASESDAQTYEDEMKYMLLHQMASPNSPQWFNTGLNWAYGITGPPQGHWYVDPKTEQLTLSKDAYTRPQGHACYIQKIKDDMLNEGGIFDLITKEARVFKYGSGTGSNFSALRASGEPLSGGGLSSGMMSFLKIFDRAAGAVKSGGTTRRAAKMVIVDMDHPDIEEFIEWKVTEEQKVASMVAGSRTCYKHLNTIIKVVNEQNTTDYAKNEQLKKAVSSAVAANVPINYIMRALALAKQGHYTINFPIYDTHYESDAYNTVSGQNSNNSASVPNSFIEAVEKDDTWKMTARTTGEVMKTARARDIWNKIAYAAWASADPGVQFNDTMNEWNTCANDDKIRGTNPCSEYVFLDDTACNLASINLGKFLRDDDIFDVNAFKHATRLWTITLEITVLMAQLPGKNLAKGTYDYRTLGLGYANLGTVLMMMSIPYDSENALAWCSALTGIMCGESYATSAEMSAVLGPFPAYERNKEHMLRVMRNHRRAAYNASDYEYENLAVKPMGLDASKCPEYLSEAARECWDRAVMLGERFGYRNAQATCIAPTGTIALVMSCDTTGIEPDFAIVKYKKLAGGGYFKIVNESVPKALKKLGYTNQEINNIGKYCKGHGTMNGCPHINAESLKAKGFTDEKINAVESMLVNAVDIKFAFNKHVLGEDFCSSVLKLAKDQLNNPNINLLKVIGFTKKQIDDANTYICGAFMLEGAPHLKDDHLPIFDCANKCGRNGKRFIAYTAHIRMMGAAQAYISGGISKTINMPADATVDDVKNAYMLAWKLMNKSIALYRDGSKLSQPLNISSDDDEDDALLQLLGKEAEDIDETKGAKELQEVIVQRVQKKQLPKKRFGITHEARLGGHKVYVRTGEYPDGSLGEIFIDMYKEGAGYKALMNCFAIAVSKALQYGVPLEEFVDTFTFTRFEPYGIVQGSENIKQATSIVDYVFRVLGYEYLGRDDLIHVKGTNDVPRIEQMKMQHETIMPKICGIGTPKQAGKQVSIMDYEKSFDETINIEKSETDAKMQGFTGEQCSNCASMKVVRAGSCAVCIDCGTTTGCS